MSGVIAQGTLLAVAADPGRTQGRAAGMPILSIVTPPAAPRPPQPPGDCRDAGRSAGRAGSFKIFIEF